MQYSLNNEDVFEIIDIFEEHQDSINDSFGQVNESINEALKETNYLFLAKKSKVIMDEISESINRLSNTFYGARNSGETSIQKTSKMMGFGTETDNQIDLLLDSIYQVVSPIFIEAPMTQLDDYDVNISIETIENILETIDFSEQRYLNDCSILVDRVNNRKDDNEFYVSISDILLRLRNFYKKIFKRLRSFYQNIKEEINEKGSEAFNFSGNNQQQLEDEKFEDITLDEIIYAHNGENSDDVDFSNDNENDERVNEEQIELLLKLNGISEERLLKLQTTFLDYKSDREYGYELSTTVLSEMTFPSYTYMQFRIQNKELLDVVGDKPHKTPILKVFERLMNLVPDFNGHVHYETERKHLKKLLLDGDLKKYIDKSKLEGQYDNLNTSSGGHYYVTARNYLPSIVSGFIFNNMLDIKVDQLIF